MEEKGNHLTKYVIRLCFFTKYYKKGNNKHLTARYSPFGYYRFTPVRYKLDWIGFMTNVNS